MRVLRGFIAQHLFAIVSLVVWVGLLLAAAWLAEVKTLVGSTAQGVLAALAGSFGSVVLAAFGIEAWQVRQKRRQERAWVARSATALTRTLHTSLKYLSDIAAGTYAVIAPELDPLERVPPQFLVNDVQRQPRQQDSAVERLDHLHRHVLSGPLVVARSQAHSLLADAAKGVLDPAAIVKPWEVLGIVSLQLQAATSLVSRLVRELYTDRTYLPLQSAVAEAEERAALRMMISLSALERAVHELTAQSIARPGTPGPNGARYLEDRQSDTSAVVHTLFGPAHTVLANIHALRKGLWQQAEVVLELAEKLASTGPSSPAEVFQSINAHFSDLQAASLEREWDAWLRDVVAHRGPRAFVRLPE